MTTDMARMIVPAFLTNESERCQTSRPMVRALGMWYSGISMMKAERSPLKSSRLRTMPDRTRSTSDSRIRPQETSAACAPKNAGAMKASTAMRAVQGTSGRDQDGQQAGLFGVDHPRAHHCRHVAAKTEEERQEGFAVQAHQVHEIVHHVGRAGHVAHVFQQAEGGKEDHHDGQEGQHRAHPAEDAIHNQAAQPGRRASQQPGRQAGQRRDHGRIQPFLHGRTEGEGQPEDQAQNPARMNRPQTGWVAQRSRRSVRLIWPMRGRDDRGADHAPDPFVAARGNRQHGIIVLRQDGLDGCPALGGQRGLHLAGHFGVAFQQLHRHPIGRVRGGDVTR